MIWRWHIHKVVLRLPDSWSNWNLKMLVFEERGKPEYPEKNLSEQTREPTTKTLFTWSGGPRFRGVGFFCFVSPKTSAAHV